MMALQLGTTKNNAPRYNMVGENIGSGSKNESQIRPRREYAKNVELNYV
jgi:hypothetical protein